MDNLLILDYIVPVSPQVPRYPVDTLEAGYLTC